jgi:uncharacterized membrane protein
MNSATLAAYALHIGGGTVGLFSGIVAVSVEKGGRLHRIAGTVFVVAMLTMAAGACYLAVAIPNQAVNFVIGIFAGYLIATAWLTVHHRPGTIGIGEKAGLAAALLLCLPFLAVSFQIASGVTLIQSKMPLKGAVAIAIFAFTAITAIAAISDIRVVWRGGIAGAPRIARHLWRMCVGLALATGSAFTNGLPHLLPKVFPPSNWLLLPQLVPILLLVFWMIRVRFTGWYKAEAAA